METFNFKTIEKKWREKFSKKKLTNKRPGNHQFAQSKYQQLHFHSKNLIKKKQELFLQNEYIIHKFRSIGKLRHKTFVFEVFLKYLYDQRVKSHIIKTF